MEGLVKLWGCPNTVLRQAQRLDLRLLSHRGGTVQNLRRAGPCTGSRIVKEASTLR